MTEQDDMPEDEFLEMPEQAMPGDLSRLWAIRSNLLHQREADELNHELAGDAPARMIFPWTNPGDGLKCNWAWRLTAQCLAQQTG